MISFAEFITEKDRCWPGYKPTPGKKAYSQGSCVKEDEQLEEKRGLWANIHARRKKGLPPKKPGQEGYPKTLNIEELELSADEQFDLIEELVMEFAEQKGIDSEIIWESLESIDDNELLEYAIDAKGHKSSEGGLTQKGVDAYNRKTGGNLKTAVTTKPSKLKPGSKAANRRKSFCARMGGMKRRLTSAKTARDPDSRINKSLRKWNC